MSSGIMSSGTFRLHATCDVGLEPVLEGELTSFGGRSITVVPRGVTFDGDHETLWRANLQSRVANRVLLELARFRVRDRDQLYAAASRIDWSRWMTPDQTLAVDSRVGGTASLAVQLANQVVKDAVCDRFRRESGRRPSVDRHAPDVPIYLRLIGDEATLGLDSSGARLHKRGYRTEAGTAPLRETLAAGVLALTGWDGQTPLQDPMCGSGTLPIEAALIARNIAPGLLRLRRGGVGFAFQRWLGHEPRSLLRITDRLRSRARKRTRAPIVGSDTHPGVLVAARRNAGRAGVADDVSLTRLNLADAEPPGEGGTLVCNPPYGARLGEPEDLEPLYKEFGDVLKQRYAGWSAFLLAGDRQLAGRVGLRPARRIVLWNGPIECRLLRYELYAGSRRTPPDVPPSGDAL